MAEVFDYEVFSLKVRSEIELPELFAAKSAGAADVIIRRGRIAAAEAAPGLHADGDALLLTVPAVGCYRIEAGREIVVEPDRDVPDRNVRLFLLGSVFGVLLHQRGLLPLHANAIEVDGKAVAFMGASGSGKSTLAAWFHDRAYRVIADDVCVVGFEQDGQPFAAPGLPRLRLWAQALELMGREIGDYPRSYAGGEQLDKFDVAIKPQSAVRARTPLAALYVLDRGDAFSLTQMTGVDAADAVFANTYRGAYVPAAKGQKSHWESAIRLVQTTPVFRVVRDWDFGKLDAQCALLLDHVRQAH